MSQETILRFQPSRPAPVGAGTPLALEVLPPLALYIHVPWCLKKCPYCDFNSHALRGEIPEADYIRCLIADLDSLLPQVWGRRLSTVFFGGGTPSLLSAEGVDQILAAVRARLPLAPDAEVTLEANPGTFEVNKFRGFRSAGVNRLSIGIQSFNPKHLLALGRVHNDLEAAQAVEIAMATFDNVNLDLMFALPEQTLDECAADLARAIAVAPPHLSVYHLTLEPNTLFHRAPPPLPDDELAADMQVMVAETLGAAGWEHYETSAWAKPSRQCQHNLNYWRFGDYLGIGAGAHGKISYPDRITRHARFKQPRAYMEAALRGDSVQESRTLSPAELPFEFMLNALRLRDGVPTTSYFERTGLPFTTIRREVALAVERGLFSADPQRIRPTERGSLFLNDLLEIFLPTP